ncbi:transposase family protein [Kitasatospora purpeofusca]|uniref:transposase family protein n=1 Tax=Kitasatospora purpeofusca TaxID=67352 RepID=UPI0036B3C4C0
MRTRRRIGRQSRRNYSGKHKAHGLLFLAVTDERGNLLWISAAKPGRASDLTDPRPPHPTCEFRMKGSHSS